MPIRICLIAPLLVLSACTASSDETQTPVAPEPTSPASISCTDAIQISSPQPNDTVGSPVTVAGQARGTWYFEASFPVRIFDVDMNELAVAPAQAQGEWMTEDFVPFDVTLPAFTTDGPLGYVLLQKDNPSGEGAHACSLVIPVQF